MDIKTYLSSLKSAEARARFAEACGTTAGHLRNCAYEPKPPSPALCVSIERESGGLVTRQELREDWAGIWPELVPVKTLRRASKSKEAA
jgi:DNA-binding transcriptional regulator YdaS (Cro superfamily)